MINICINCAASIESETEYDNGFYYDIGDTSGWHSEIEKIYRCENGCETNEPVRVESELGRRFYRRFKCEPKSKTITIKVPK